MKHARPILLLGIVLLWAIALFPPRRPQTVEQSHLSVSRAFLLSDEFYLERSDATSIRAEIDTGRMLAEIVIVVTSLGLILVLFPPAPRGSNASPSA